jgi:Rho-binding antiterminator
MKVFYLGRKPSNFPPALDWRRWGEEPMFEVDAFVLFNLAGDLTSAEIEKAQLAGMHGRPWLYFGEMPFSPFSKSARSWQTFEPEKMMEEYLQALSALPRTNYQPIDCNFYDNFEAAIVQRRSVKIKYRGLGESPLRIETRLLDTKTDKTEEYVQFRNGDWLRLDRVISVDGLAAGESCRF